MEQNKLGEYYQKFSTMGEQPVHVNGKHVSLTCGCVDEIMYIQMMSEHRPITGYEKYPDTDNWQKLESESQTSDFNDLHNAIDAVFSFYN